jgi:uncharacterized protein (TIGR04255 family)
MKEGEGVAASAPRADDLVPLREEIEGGFATNFIREAVCELRFPTLMSLSAPRPPERFVAALRRHYPTYETMNELTVTAGESSFAGRAHQFRSVKPAWTVTLKQNAVALNTIRYSTFADFRNRVHELLSAALEVIDANFFTRIGLRYINTVRTDGPSMAGWINPALVAPLQDQGFRGISEYTGRITLSAEDGGCLLQHGIQFKPSDPQLDGPAMPDYFLDVDSFRDDVPADRALTSLDGMHRQAFSMFMWALGPMAVAKLQGERTLKQALGPR